MKKSEQKTTDGIKSEKAKFEIKASYEDSEWLNSPPVGKESL